MSASDDQPDNLDPDRIAEAALALLSLTLHDGRVWKSLDWPLMDDLHKRGWISDPRTKARSVMISEEAAGLAQDFLVKHFGKR